MSKFIFLMTILFIFGCKNESEITLEKWDNGKPKKVRIIDRINEYETNYYENGKVESHGLIIENQKEKDWKFYYQNGKDKKQIFYRENKPFGNAVYFFENGNIKTEGSFDEEGIKVDLWKTYSKNGSLFSKGMFDRGIKVKTWNYYFPEGKLKKQESIDPFGDIMFEKIYNSKGALIRKSEFYKKNQLKKESYKIDSLSKKIMVREFYELGQIKAEGKKLNGFEIGNWTFWYSNGNKKAEGQFLENPNLVNYQNIDFKIRSSDLPLQQKFREIKIGRWIFWNDAGRKVAEVDYVLRKDRIIEKVNCLKL